MARGLPDGVDLPPEGRERVEELKRQSDGPPYGVRFRQGEEIAEEEVVEIDTDRGGELIILHFEDGRHVTVNAARELEGVW